MDITRPTPLLGGLSPEQFMRRHWQKKPLLVRGAVPGMRPLVPRSELFEMAGRDDVESRLVTQQRGTWELRRGPFARRSIPPLSRDRWTILVQGLDLHVQAAHELMQRFAFVPQARIDDVMVSFATDGGGVGPHYDSYDVFLIQAHGKRLWRYGRLKDHTLLDGLPVKILANFEPEEEHVLEPGDMLYLPPRWGHDGIAQGECQTYSVGFRTPMRGELAAEVLHRLAGDAADEIGDAIYRDPRQGATNAPGRIPEALHDFAREAMQAALAQPHALERAVGEYLTEPKSNVWFDGEGGEGEGAVRLDRRTRMMYDDRHVFINGESYRAGGRDATLMRALADQRRLTSAQWARASEAARDLVASWIDAGWAHAGESHD